MPESRPRLEALFGRVVAARRGIVLAHALLVPVAAWLALGIRHDDAIERMVVADDPDVVATREFERVFPEKPTVLLIAESADPLAPAALAAFDALEAELGATPGLSPVSARSIWRRLRPAAAADDADFRRFVNASDFLRRQGLAGRDFLAVAVTYVAATPEARDVALAAIEGAVAASGAEIAASPIRLRRVGEAFVGSWIERETRSSSARYLPLFGAFVVALVLFLYRSWRALAAILATLAVAVLFGVALGALAGFTQTIVSALVPLSLMVTATASLVYLHSRFVDALDGVDLEAHRRFAFANKFWAVTASVAAAAVGFGALAVSRIRPIREMGLWTSGGLVLGWAVCFTLFPALQKLFAAPAGRERTVAGAWIRHAAERLPRASYRWRYALLGVSLALNAAGLVAVFGLPGRVAPMRLGVDALDYLDPDLAIVRDARWFGEHGLGLGTASIWIRTPSAGVLDPAFLAGLDRFAARLAAEPEVGAVVGLPALVRFRRELAGAAEAPISWPRAAEELEQLLLSEPALRDWIDAGGLDSTRLDLLARPGAAFRPEAIAPRLDAIWRETAAAEPALAGATARVVGRGLVGGKIAVHLVPTLVQSFALTAAVIFATFLLVFRSGAARLMAMVPSLFAILVMFLVMRIFSIPLNVATILIATTVLGATENDQIHFFWHFQEKRREGTTEQALAHAIRVAGSAMVFATLINAGGFLALAASGFPPMRQFGILTSTAFALALLADFTALPAALWIFLRQKPDATPEQQED
ncbi:MAG: MMPL family transporter [Thermoanaerobaculia bacterium]